MWFNDDDPEKVQSNWKNSEVTRLFAEQYIDKLAEKKECDICGKEHDDEEEKAEEDNEVEEEGVQELVVILEPVALAKKEIDEVIEKLAVLAEESMEYGNEKAIYLIERTIEEVRDIKDNLGA